MKQLSKTIKKRTWFTAGLLILGVMFLGACNKLSTTQKNINLVDQILPNQDQVQKASTKNKTDFDETAPIPIEVFIGGRITAHETSNTWINPLERWAKQYQDMAIDEMHLRHASLSYKYSKKAVLWAQRAKQIQNEPQVVADRKVKRWLAQERIEQLPDYPQYFAGQDAYEGLQTMHMFLSEISQDQDCYPVVSPQVIPMKIRYEWASDLLRKKFYKRSDRITQRDQSAMARVREKMQMCHFAIAQEKSKSADTPSDKQFNFTMETPSQTFDLISQDTSNGFINQNTSTEQNMPSFSSASTTPSLMNAHPAVLSSVSYSASKSISQQDQGINTMGAFYLFLLLILLIVSITPYALYREHKTDL